MRSCRQVERLRKELHLLQQLAAGAVRQADAFKEDDDVAALVAENDDLRRRLRQGEGDCELAMCELEVALAQVDALDPADLQGHEAEVQAARRALCRAAPAEADGFVTAAVGAVRAEASCEWAEEEAEEAVEAGTEQDDLTYDSDWSYQTDLVAPPRQEMWTA